MKSTRIPAVGSRWQSPFTGTQFIVTRADKSSTAFCLADDRQDEPTTMTIFTSQFVSDYELVGEE